MFPSPTNKKALERFLGLSGWCSKFIPNYATLVEPLNNLRRKDIRWGWSGECQNAFEQLKEVIARAVSLSIPDCSRQFEVHTDASGVGLGAALMQVNHAGELRVIAFASRALSNAEGNYSATELECLAVIWALEKWRPYLEGSSTVVYTDHQALVWMLRAKALKGRLMRWALRLQEFDYIIHYRPGSQNVVPDALSRAVIGVVNYDQNVCFHPDCKGDPSSKIFWIQCENCDRWFHWVCLGLSKEEVDKIDNYHCAECSSGISQAALAESDECVERSIKIVSFQMRISSF
ncbi:hypothetical protein BSL78_27037 [Apostichopus japonicus]|uniref:Zinc finger PHD-type domain-containing protein n=1 Tax=Stichopus japonicus TaxID=307972 RepID=A0A2G8JK58_STIJA|nr:hypothetical protein BSL78_27037 [Apostichopus japonicus]